MKNLREVTESFDNLIQSLYEPSDIYVPSEKRKDFEHQFELLLWYARFAMIEALASESLTVFKEHGAEMIQAFIVPEKREEYLSQIELKVLHSNIALIEDLSKEVFNRSGAEWEAMKQRILEARRKYIRQARRCELLLASTEQELKAALGWMAERGTDDDLPLIRKVKKSTPFASKKIKEVFRITEMRIKERRQKVIDYTLQSFPKDKVLALKTNKVIKALSDNKWDFRTINGLARETGLAEEEVSTIIEKQKALIRKSVVPDKYANDLYTLRSRPIKLRERFAEIWYYLNKYFDHLQ